VSELYRPSDRRLSKKLVPTFADRWCQEISVTDPYGRNLGFLDRFKDLLLYVISGPWKHVASVALTSKDCMSTMLLLLHAGNKIIQDYCTFWWFNVHTKFNEN
jgi:hypothetical protein